MITLRHRIDAHIDEQFDELLYCLSLFSPSGQVYSLYFNEPDSPQQDFMLVKGDSDTRNLPLICDDAEVFEHDAGASLTILAEFMGAKNGQAAKLTLNESDAALFISAGRDKIGILRSGTETIHFSLDDLHDDGPASWSVLCDILLAG